MDNCVTAMLYFIFIWSVSSLGMLVIYAIFYQRYKQITGYVTPRLKDISIIASILALTPVCNSIVLIIVLVMASKNRHVLNNRIVLLLSKPKVDEIDEFISSFI